MYTIDAYMGGELLNAVFALNGLDCFKFDCDMFCADYCIDNRLTHISAVFIAVDNHGKIYDVYAVNYEKFK